MPISDKQPVVTIIILCCNQAPVTQVCLESLARHTPNSHQLILVDNGSTDNTPMLLQQHAQTGHAGLVELVLMRLEQNLGFARAVNLALPRASGEYLVLLNNDTVLTPHWLEGLLGVARNVSQAGMVGPVSNEVPAPQQVAPGYDTSLNGLDTFAQNRRTAYARQVMEVDRLSGFCLLIPRAVMHRIGSLDEQFGLGFFEDDDLGFRMKQAGYRLLIALDTYIHHWGSQTFRGLGLATEQMLLENHQKFRLKWGDQLADRYHLPTPTQALSDPPIITSLEAPATFTLMMIVRNEAHNLGDCLDSVIDLFTNAVIVDTGSTDETKAIAEKYGATVIDFPWVDSFAAARNVALEHATGDYVFWMDADDRLDEANRQKLKQLMASLPPGRMVGLNMKCLCLPDPESGQATVVDHIRLFTRHPDVRWKYRIHEQILPALRQHQAQVQTTDICIHHVGYQDVALRQKKLERDLRLLHLENAEHPDDPFTLFNLGSVSLDLRQAQEAIPLLERSLNRSHPGDSIVRKLYALLVHAYRQIDQRQAALGICRQGLSLFPQDAELQFQHGIILRDLGNLPGAAQVLEQLLHSRDENHFASVSVGFRGYLTRYNLAVIYRDQQRWNEALAQWNLVLEEMPDYLPALTGQAETFLTLNQPDAVQPILERLQPLPGQELLVQFLTARKELCLKKYPEAQRLLEAILQEHPEHLPAKIYLSHVALQSEKWSLALEILEDLVQRDPTNQEAINNLRILRQKMGS